MMDRTFSSTKEGREGQSKRERERELRKHREHTNAVDVPSVRSAPGAIMATALTDGL